MLGRQQRLRPMRCAPLPSPQRGPPVGVQGLQLQQPARRSGPRLLGTWAGSAGRWPQIGSSPTLQDGLPLAAASWEAGREAHAPPPLPRGPTAAALAAALPARGGASSKRIQRAVGLAATPSMTPPACCRSAWMGCCTTVDLAAAHWLTCTVPPAAAGPTMAAAASRQLQLQATPCKRAMRWPGQHVTWPAAWTAWRRRQKLWLRRQAATAAPWMTCCWL